MTLTTIRVRDDTVDVYAIPNIWVEIYDTNRFFVTSGLTDENGEVTFALPDASYDIFLYKRNVSVLPRQPQRIVVDALLSNTFLVLAHKRAHPESLDIHRCTIHGHISGIDGKRALTRLVFSAVPEIMILNNELVSPQTYLEVASDHTGYFEFELLRGVTYRAFFAHVEMLLDVAPFKMEAVVPDASSIPIVNFLFPLPLFTSFSDDELLLQAGNDPDDSIVCSSSFSDGNIKTKGSPWAGIQVTCTNNLVAEAGIYDGRLIVKPLSAGTTIISTERKLNSRIRWTPIQDYLSQSVMVTVI